jgi:hypothetical protein
MANCTIYRTQGKEIMRCWSSVSVAVDGQFVLAEQRVYERGGRVGEYSGIVVAGR